MLRSDTGHNPCGRGLFRCGASSICIPDSQRCDRVADCPGNNPADEKGCQGRSAIKQHRY